MTPAPASIVAALSLVAGFGVAELTGVRAIGGVVLVAGGFWCFRQWRRDEGRRVAWTLAGVMLVAFVGSHLLGLVIGAWPSVATVAVGTGLAAEWQRARTPVRT